MPVIIRQKLTAIESHAENLLTEKYETPGGKQQEYLFILREIDGIEKRLKKISKDLQAYQKVCQVLDDGGPPELVLKRIENIRNEREAGLGKNSSRHTFNSAVLVKILHRTIDQFLKYQYENGFEEPRAREDAIMDVIGALEQRAQARAKTQRDME